MQIAISDAFLSFLFDLKKTKINSIYLESMIIKEQSIKRSIIMYEYFNNYVITKCLLYCVVLLMLIGSGQYTVYQCAISIKILN